MYQPVSVRAFHRQTVVPGGLLMMCEGFFEPDIGHNVTTGCVSTKSCRALQRFFLSTENKNMCGN